MLRPWGCIFFSLSQFIVLLHLQFSAVHYCVSFEIRPLLHASTQGQRTNPTYLLRSPVYFKRFHTATNNPRAALQHIQHIFRRFERGSGRNWGGLRLNSPDLSLLLRRQQHSLRTSSRELHRLCHVVRTLVRSRDVKSSHPIPKRRSETQEIDAQTVSVRRTIYRIGSNPN